MLTLSVLAQLDIISTASGGALHAGGSDLVDPFVFRLSIFVLAVSVELVRNDSGPVWARILGFLALILASVNIFGGFLVTQRMLAMYQKKKK